MGCSQDLKATGLILFKNLVEVRVFLLYLVFNLLEISVAYSHWASIQSARTRILLWTSLKGDIWVANDPWPAEYCLWFTQSWVN